MRHVRICVASGALIGGVLALAASSPNFFESVMLGGIIGLIGGAVFGEA